jgi:putative glutamine amidotransferase
LTVTARGFDGTVQGIERTGEPWCVAVQWHPEENLEDVRVFRGLIEAASR